MQETIGFYGIGMVAVLLLLTQLGFTALETGIGRIQQTSRFVVHTLRDSVTAIIFFWACGFGLMFGAQSWFAGFEFFPNAFSDSQTLLFFTTQLLFASTAMVIVSAAVLYRMPAKAHLLSAMLVGAIIYPVTAHWIWGGYLPEGSNGWLAELGFIDFAGASAVHSLGAWVGLAAALVFKDKIQSSEQAPEMPQRTLILVGGVVLGLAWLGLNGGGMLMNPVAVGTVVGNTLLALVAGGIAAWVIMKLLASEQPVSLVNVMKGMFAGLIAITASSGFVDLAGAVMIGILAAALSLAVSHQLHKYRINDPLGMISIHGVGGVWGTLAAALFIAPVLRPAGGILAQLGVQLLGVLSIFAWAFGVACVVFFLARRIHASYLSRNNAKTPSAITPKPTHDSLEQAMWMDCLTVMQDVAKDGDLARRVNVRCDGAMGEMATRFNHMLDALQQNASQVVGKQPNNSELQQKCLPDIHRLQSRCHRTEDLLSDSAQTLHSAQNGSKMISTTANELSDSIAQQQAVIDKMEERTFKLELLVLNATIAASEGAKQQPEFNDFAEQARVLAEQNSEDVAQIRRQSNELAKGGKRLLAQAATLVESCQLGKEQAQAVGRELYRVNYTAGEVHRLVEAMADATTLAASVNDEQNQAASPIAK